MQRRGRRVLSGAVIVALGVGGASGSAPADEEAAVWPVRDVQVVRAYEAPAHRYGAGHRGIDVRADVGTEVRAPADGRAAYAGSVAGRGVVTVDAGGGLVWTLEPVTPSVRSGDAVAQGDVVGVVGLGGHAAPGTLHVGLRIEGEYVNPLLLLGGIPRAVLLPCC